MVVELLTQLNDQKRKVDFDSYDISVKELVSMIIDSFIDIAPEYQRQFRWKPDRQSLLVESVFLGIPIPSLFMAANPDGTWELIDGVQRLSTLIHYIGDEQTRSIIGETKPLKLTGLEKLSYFNDLTYDQLPQAVQLQFLLKPLKVTTISDKSDRDIRFDLFERLNTGGVILTSQEIRSCVFRGPFNEMLRELAEEENFRTVVKFPKERQLDGTKEEFILRFFAYFDDYTRFQHSVRDFLNDYMKRSTNRFDYHEKVPLFHETFTLLSEVFPNGITRTNRGTTPANLYEAVSVGAALASMEQGRLVTSNVEEWVHSEELRHLTTGATNSNPRVRARIEYCRDRFLGR